MYAVVGDYGSGKAQAVGLALPVKDGNQRLKPDENSHHRGCDGYSPRHFIKSIHSVNPQSYEASSLILLA